MELYNYECINPVWFLHYRNIFFYIKICTLLDVSIFVYNYKLANKEEH